MKMLMMFIMFFAAVITHSMEADLSLHGSLHRGNQSSSLYGGKLLFDLGDFETKMLAEFQKFEDQHYSKWQIGANYDALLKDPYGVFVLADVGKDTKKKVDLSSLIALGGFLQLSKHVKYYLGGAFETFRSDGEQFQNRWFYHRLKLKHRVPNMFEIIGDVRILHDLNKLRTGVETGIRFKLWDNIRFGVSQLFEYETHPLPGVSKEDFVFKGELILTFGSL